MCLFIDHSASKAHTLWRALMLNCPHWLVWGAKIVWSVKIFLNPWSDVSFRVFKTEAKIDVFLLFLEAFETRCSILFLNGSHQPICEWLYHWLSLKLSPTKLNWIEGYRFIQTYPNCISKFETAVETWKPFKIFWSQRSCFLRICI